MRGVGRAAVGGVPTAYIGLDGVEGPDGVGTGEVCREAVSRLISAGAGGIAVYAVRLAPPSLVGRGEENVAWALEARGDPWDLLEELGELVAEMSGPGSGPGLALVLDSPPADRLVALAERITREPVSLEEVRRVAESHGVELWELGGDGSGAIGAFAAAVLSSAGLAERVELEV